MCGESERNDQGRDDRKRKRGSAVGCMIRQRKRDIYIERESENLKGKSATRELQKGHHREVTLKEVRENMKEREG